MQGVRRLPEALRIARICERSRRVGISIFRRGRLGGAIYSLLQWEGELSTTLKLNWRVTSSSI